MKKISVKKIGKYLRELSVVVIGIALSFTVNNLIIEKNNKKDLELYIEEIKLELQDNLITVNKQKKYYQHAVAYSNYLLKNQMKNLNPDSLSHYYGLNHEIPFFGYKSSAFDMLKISGNMRLIKDKRKVQILWTCYHRMEALRVASDFYIQRKVNELDKYNGFSEKIKNESLFGFFTMGISETWLKAFNECSEAIESTLLQL